LKSSQIILTCNFYFKPRIICTPGRLLHVIKETGLTLNTIEYLVMDEADRLFEMGLSSQIDDLMKKLPSNRQTCLFSATMPTVNHKITI
jgi:ATP-dependent RNA helicase DDX54/DBP10